MSSGGVCTGETLSDEHHCGACGHSCLGGACVGGVCQSVVVYENLSVDLYRPTGAFVSDGTIMVTQPAYSISGNYYEGLALLRGDVRGDRALERVGLIPVSHSNTRTFEVGADPRGSFFLGGNDAGENCIYEVKATGNQPVRCTWETQIPNHVVSEGWAYWTELGAYEDTLWRGNAFSGPQRLAILTIGPARVHRVHGGHVYLTAQEGVYRAPVTGGPATLSNPHACNYSYCGDLAVDDRGVVVVDGRTIFSGAHGAALQELTTVPGDGVIGPVHLDATHVYWAYEGIFRIPRDGGAVLEVVADDGAWYQEVLGDETALYWLDHAYNLRRLAKPLP